MNQLRFAVERHPDEPRRTLFFAGTGSTSPIDGLHLAQAASSPVGGPYQADLLGEQVRGSVWFRSEHQCGLTVDGWGDGLLVVSHLEPSDAKPDGAAMAVLSLYGGDDQTYDAVEGRWQAWWAEHHPMEAPAVPD